MKLIDNDLIVSKISFFFEFLYVILNGARRTKVANFIFFVLMKIEGGANRSLTVRKLLKRDYGIDVGVHTYGDVLIPKSFSPTVKIGNYVSVAKGVKVYTQNHPVERLSTHPYFYSGDLGYLDEDCLPEGQLDIGHDVWLGANAVILPGCNLIGTGAVVGAGSIVTKDVPPFSIVAGNPARIIGYRFSEEIIEQLLESEWWLYSMDDIANYVSVACSGISIDLVVGKINQDRELL